MSNVRSIPPPFGMLPFLSGADLFLPADPAGTLTIETVPRGNVAATRVLRIPNVRSTEARVTVQLNDFE
jgi:hypothetical protein